MNREGLCQFQFENGFYCEELLEGKAAFCFFHDAQSPKNTPEARRRILEAVHAKKRLDESHLEGADLSHADLTGAHLVKAHLNGCNFERTILDGAHLYGANLQGANLFNAHLHRANLKESNLEGANLLEAKINEAKILGIHWGKKGWVHNEVEARKAEKAGDLKKAKEKYREAEEIYRNFRIHLMAGGIFDEAANFFYREMVVRRKQAPYFSLRRFSSKMIDLICGYGEKTFRVISVAFVFVILNATLYFFTGIQYKNLLLVYNPSATLAENFHTWLLSFYFSMVTFTTLGYGDIAPVGISRAYAMEEAFFGAFMIALFVLVFSRKMIR